MYARPPLGGLAFLLAFALLLLGEGGDEMMKLYLFFVVMDILILLAYPVLFIASKLREMLKNKQ